MPETLAPPGLLAPAPRRAQYREYQQAGIDRVREFYRNNHTHQTLDFVLAKKDKWLQFQQRAMTPRVARIPRDEASPSWAMSHRSP